MMVEYRRSTSRNWYHLDTPPIPAPILWWWHGGCTIKFLSISMQIFHCNHWITLPFEFFLNSGTRNSWWWPLGKTLASHYSFYPALGRKQVRGYCWVFRQLSNFPSWHGDKPVKGSKRGWGEGLGLSQPNLAQGVGIVRRMWGAPWVAFCSRQDRWEMECNQYCNLRGQKKVKGVHTCKNVSYIQCTAEAFCYPSE